MSPEPTTTMCSVHSCLLCCLPDINTGKYRTPTATSTSTSTVQYEIFRSESERLTVSFSISYSSEISSQFFSRFWKLSCLLFTIGYS